MATRKTAKTTTKSAAAKGKKAKPEVEEAPTEELATVQTEALATGGGEEGLDTTFDFGEETGDGFEEFTQADIKTPFLHQLQPLSPAVANREIDCKPGDFLNSGSGDLYEMEQGVVFIPIKKKHHWVEWKTRKNGGGFVASHEVDSPFVAAFLASESDKPFKDRLTEGGNNLIESHDFYALLLSDDGKTWDGKFCMISFTSTKIKACRDMCTQMYSLLVPVTVNGKKTRRRPPLFCHRVRMTGYQDMKNNDVFWNIKCAPLVPGSWMKSLINPQTESELFNQAKEQFIGAQDKMAQVDYAAQAEETKAASQGTIETTAEEAAEGLGF